MEFAAQPILVTKHPEASEKWSRLWLATSRSLCQDHSIAQLQLASKVAARFESHGAAANSIAQLQPDAERKRMSLHVHDDLRSTQSLLHQAVPSQHVLALSAPTDASELEAQQVQVKQNFFLC